jgi:CRP-like cAMP-binding protein
MTTRCSDCPLRRTALHLDLSPDDVAFMTRFKVGELTVEPGTTLLTEGTSAPRLYTVLRGMGLRFKTLENGRRQVLNLVFPGDFIGLQAGIMGEMRHSVEASSAMTLCVFDRKAFWSFFRANPERAFDLTWLAAVDEHFMGEALATIGQRSATEKVAWALIRIMQRGRALGLDRDGALRLPYRQQDLADALGLSLVHTNKTLARRRERQLASWHDRTLSIADMDRLAELACMELDPLPRRPLM